MSVMVPWSESSCGWRNAAAHGNSIPSSIVPPGCRPSFCSTAGSISREICEGESTPHDLVELAARHPRATFIDAHTGGDWELGIRTIRPAKNISTCVAGFDPTSGVVEMAVRELGAERVIFGSDAAGRSFASQLAKVMGAEIPQTREG